VQNFFIDGLPVVMAAVATAVFLYIFWRSGVTICRRFRQPEERVLCACPADNYRIAITSLAYVVGIKLVIMIAAHIITGKADFFTDAASLWERSDAPHYISIARDGYQAVGEDRVFIAFFPLFPMLLGTFARFTGEYFWTGSLLSMACLTMAGYFLFKIARDEHGEKAAYRTLKYFMLFPSIFFAMFPYSEGLFLLLLFSSFYYLRQKRYVLSGLLGLLAALTRSVGVLMVFPYAIQVAEDVWEGRIDGGFFRRLFRKGWPVFLIPVGTLCYLAINWVVQGNPFSFLAVQESHWGQGMDLLPHTVWYLARNLFTYELEVALPLWGAELLVIFVVLAAMALASEHQRPTFLVYSIVFFYFSISLTWLLSAPRYMLVMFPLFIEMGRRCRSKTTDWIMTCVTGGCMLIFSCACAIGYSIF